MASPVVAGTAESSTNTAGTSHVLSWTGLGTVAAGDLLIIVLDKGSTAATVNAHADWTELLDENNGNGLYIAYRWATGGETAPTLTTSASTRSAEITYRITGADDPATNPPAIGTTATGTSATPDPPSITPPSSKDYLFIAVAGMAGEEADDDTWGNTPPTDYTPSPPRQKSCGTAGTNLGGLILSAERALTTGSAENPGTFGVDASAAWRAQTIIIHPTSLQTFSGGDTASFTEGFTKQVGTPESETVSLTEAFTKMAGIVRGDTVGFSEGFSAIILKLSSVSDTLGLSESLTFIKNANVAVGDTVALTETFIKSVAKTTSDTLGLTEGFTAVRTLLSNLGDTLGITEIFTKGIQQQRAETVSLTENLATQVSGGGGGGPRMLMLTGIGKAWLVLALIKGTYNVEY
jgi:hypothetical protein